MSKKVLNFLPFLWLIFFPLRSSAEQILEKTFAGRGPFSFTFNVEKWGRYSIQAFNAEGTSLQIYDKRSGPGLSDGIPGERNGRLDLLLEKGEYKIVARSHRARKHKTTVRVFSFTELNRDNPLSLLPHKLTESKLCDLQQVSFWMTVESEKILQLEAVGRNLADVQLLLSGTWRVDARSESFKSLPTPETPLKGIRLVAKVKPGLYLVTAYGGKEADWSENSDRHPLYFLRGIRRIASSGVQLKVISPLGYNQYLVSKEATAVVVETPQKVPFKLTVSPFSQERPYQSAFAEDSIHVQSNAPCTLVRLRRRGADFYRIKVSGKPGQTFLLQTLQLVKTLPLRVSGDYWLSTLHTGDPGDQIGASGVLVKSSQRHQPIYRAQLDTLTRDKMFFRRFNLLENINLYVWVSKSGKYEVIPDGVEVRWKIERFFALRPRNYRPAATTTGKGVIELEPGLHTLELFPVRKGILSLRIRGSSFFSKIKEITGISSTGDSTLNSGLPGIQFPSIKLNRDERYDLYLNSQAPELAGVLLRPLPLALIEPLPIYLAPGATVSVPVKFPQKMQVSVQDIDNRSYAFKLNGTEYQGEQAVRAGSCYTLSVSNPSRNRVYVVANATVPATLPGAPTLPITADRLAKLPKFPTLVSGQTDFFDLRRNDEKIYELDVDTPGIYRLETTGRLHTQLTVRSRLETNLFSASGNGVGRNAMLVEYLIAGKYQVFVKTLGRSTGHLGLSLQTNELIEGGELKAGRDRRTQVPLSAGISYHFSIPDSGRYRVQSFGQEGYFRARLEDDDGWPLLRPGIKADIEMVFAPRGYRLFSLPESRASRRIARLDKIEAAPVFDGKGPHNLALNQTASSIWEEEKIDGVRRSAIFILEIPAPLKATLFVSEGFAASLKRKGDAEAIFSWRGQGEAELEMGHYEVTVMALKEQNHLDYQLSVNTRLLVPGQSFFLTQPQVLEISIGKSSVVEIFSQGTDDVSAKLFNEDESNLLAENDDAFLDWNFNISKFLRAGRYRLTINSEKGPSFRTLVNMRSLTDTLFAPLTAGSSLESDLRGKIATVPLQRPTEANIIHVVIRGQSNVACLIEGLQPGEEATGLAEGHGAEISLALPVTGDRHQLRVWSEDHLNENISITFEATQAIQTSLRDLTNGWSGLPQSSKSNKLWFRVDMGSGRLGHYRVNSTNTSNPVLAVHTTALANAAFSSEGELYFSSFDEDLWLQLSFAGAGRADFQLTRFKLTQEKRVRIPLSGHAPRAFHLTAATKALSVVLVETDAGQPLAGVYTKQNGTFYPKGIPVYGGQDWASRKCTTVDFPDDSHTVLIWNAAPDQIAGQAYANIVLHSIPISDEYELQLGQQQWQTSKAECRKYRLPKSRRVLVKVKIPQAGLAVWRNDDGTRQVIFADKDVAVAEFDAASGRLFLASLDNGGRFSIEGIAMDEIDLPAHQELQLTLDHGIERRFTRPGEIKVQVPTAKVKEQPLVVLYGGAVQNVTWVSADGFIRNGLPSEAELVSRASGLGGFLKINHGAGGMKLNLAEKDEILQRKWGRSIAPNHPFHLKVPVVLPLTQKLSWFSLIPSELQHIRLQADGGLVGILVSDDQIVGYHSQFESFDWEMPLEPGRYFVGLRKFAYDDADLERLTYQFHKIETLAEGDRPKLFLAPGESRIFRFSLPQKKTIGFGLKAEKEVVQARLYDHNWRLLAQGKQQFQTLEKGDYYLWLHLPRYQEATACTPILVGQNVPPDQPPEEVVKRIIDEQ